MGVDGAGGVRPAQGGTTALSSACAVHGLLCVAVRREGEGRREKGKKNRKREKGKKKEKGERERERAMARFAAAVDARARRLQSEATPTQNEEKGNTRTGIEFGCRNGGSSEKDFKESGARTEKNLE